MTKTSPSRPGRKKEWSENVLARFAAGTLARISEVICLDESRTDFMRTAVDREISRRRRKPGDEGPQADE
jgi:hypothetical protein